MQTLNWGLITVVCLILVHAVLTDIPLYPHISGQQLPKVLTKSGAIYGKITSLNGNELAIYLGVPYATPPLGKLRFRRPAAIKPWNIPVTADEMAPACPQYSPVPFPWKDKTWEQSEDCLYLNLWVPSSSNSSKAVMFWIHGGSFFVGSNKLPVYNGEVLASMGDVIVVTVNYRLGILGFLSSGTDDAPSNNGIYDVLLALQWVNDNIEYFGGDKSRITIFGESAGSVITSYLCLSSLAAGLFSRAIMQSATAPNLLINNNTVLAQDVAKTVGCASETFTFENNPRAVVKCLRKVDAQKLVHVVGLENPKSITNFLPAHDDVITGFDPTEALIRGDFNDVSILIGTVRDEGSFILTTAEIETFGYFGEKHAETNKNYGEMIMRNYFQAYPYAESIIQYYLGQLNEDDYYSVRQQVYRAFGDSLILCPSVYFAEEYAESGNNVYHYHFTRRSSTTPYAPWMGVAHFEEVQYVFGQPLIRSKLYEREEIELSISVMKKWTNFAKTGNPGGYWPLYSREFPQVKILTWSDVRFGYGPHSENCDFWRPYFGFY